MGKWGGGGNFPTYVRIPFLLVWDFNPFVPGAHKKGTNCKKIDPEIRRDHQKNFYERLDYESIEDELNTGIKGLIVCTQRTDVQN